MLPDEEEDWPAFDRTLCGKMGFLTRKDARREAHRRRVPAGGHMRAYRCPYCPFWHAGHLPWLVRTGKITAKEFYRLARGGNLPRLGQRPVDMTGGVLVPREVADMFRVETRTVLEWARAYQADDPGRGQLEAFQTPGGQWRFSKAAVLAALENGHHGN